MNRHKKLMLITVALLALVLAGVGGAVVKYTIYRVNPGQFAGLSGTNVLCGNVRSTGPGIPGFACLLYVANQTHPVGRSYELFITARNISVERTSPNGRTVSVVRQYVNP